PSAAEPRQRGLPSLTIEEGCVRNEGAELRPVERLYQLPGAFTRNRSPRAAGPRGDLDDAHDESAPEDQSKAECPPFTCTRLHGSSPARELAGPCAPVIGFASSAG